MIVVPRKYGVAVTVNFQLWATNGKDLKTDAAFAAGDVVIMKDDGTEANITTLPTDEGKGYSLALSATEMQAARVVVYVVDQDATKLWIDEVIVIETYGHPSAMHEWDFDVPDVEVIESAYQGDLFPGDIVNLLFNTKANKVMTTLVGGTVSVYKNNGTTESASGVVLTVDFDGRTGAHQVAISTNANSAFYTAGDDFYAVLTAGTVGGVSVVGTRVGSWSISARHASIWGSYTVRELTGVSAGHASGIRSAVGLAAANLDAQLGAIEDLVDELESRLTAARAAYLDNLNAGGVLASQADILALNQSASRRLIVTTVPQYERPEVGTRTYTIEARTYTGDGAAVNADSTPILTATGPLSGDLTGNTGGPPSNPSTGVYRWTYTVEAADTLEEVRLDVSVVVGGDTFTLAAYTQIADFVAATWTTDDRASLTAVFNKLPGKARLAGTDNVDGSIELDDATGNYPGTVGGLAAAGATSLWNTLTAGMTTVGGIGKRILDFFGAGNYMAPDNASAAAAAASAAAADTKAGNIQTRIPAALTAAGKMKADAEHIEGVDATDQLDAHAGSGGGGGGTGDATLENQEEMLAYLAAIRATTDLITPETVIITNLPKPTTGTLPLVRGDAYMGQRAIVRSFDTTGLLPDDITGSAVWLRVKDMSDPDSDLVINVEGEILEAVGPVKTFRFEVPASDTDDLHEERYQADVEVLIDSDEDLPATVAVLEAVITRDARDESPAT
jgi:hypothetical protein